MVDSIPIKRQIAAVLMAACVPPVLVLGFALMAQFAQGFSLSELKAMLMAAGVIAFPVSLFAVVVAGMPLTWIYQRLGLFQAIPVILTGAVVGAGVFYLFIDYMAASFGGPGGSEPSRLLATVLAGAVAGGLSAFVYWWVMRGAEVGK